MDPRKCRETQGEAAAGCPFFWLLFFGQAKKSDSRPASSAGWCSNARSAAKADETCRLHLEGASKPWREASDRRREQRALIAELDLYQGEHCRNLNRLEALLSRHWPELDRIAELNSAGVLHLIADYGTPQAVCDHREGHGVKRVRSRGHHLAD